MEAEVKPVAQDRPKKQDRTTIALLLVAALIAVGGMGFAAGRFTAPSTTSPAGNGTGNPGFGGGGRNFPSLAPGQTFNTGQFGGGIRANVGSISGTVQSVDANSITIKLANGTTVTIALNGSTTYHNETAATAGDVQTGSTVTVEISGGALAGGSPAPGASGQFGGRSLTASSVLITTP